MQILAKWLVTQLRKQDANIMVIAYNNTALIR